MQFAPSQTVRLEINSLHRVLQFSSSVQYRSAIAARVDTAPIATTYKQSWSPVPHPMAIEAIACTVARAVAPLLQTICARE